MLSFTVTRGFDLLFVAEQRKLAARGDAGRPAGAGPGLCRAAADHGQVVRQRYPVVACKLGKIRPDLVLADLKPKDGLPAAPGFGGLCIVAAGSGEFMVQMADQRRACRPQHRAAVGHGGEKVARRVGALLAVGIVGGGGIQPGRVGPAGCAEQPVHRGAAGFAVSCLSEARHLRRHSVTLPILILGYTDPAFAGDLARRGITQAVFSAEYARSDVWRAVGLPEVRCVCSGRFKILSVVRGKDDFQCRVLRELREAAAPGREILS